MLSSSLSSSIFGPFGRLTHFRHAMGLLLLLTYSLLGLQACKNSRSPITQEQAEFGMGLPDSSSSGERHQLDPRCPDSQLLNADSVKPDSPEAVILAIMTAAHEEGDDDARFDRFASHFASQHAVKWIREQYWPRAKEHVGSYLQEDEGSDITVKICERRENKQTGEIKFFIESLNPKKSNPPITLKQDDEDDSWKIVFYTP